MSLTHETASRKDSRTAQYGVHLEHRHFSFIAAVLKELRPIASAESERGRQHAKTIMLIRLRPTHTSAGSYAIYPLVSHKTLPYM